MPPKKKDFRCGEASPEGLNRIEKCCAIDVFVKFEWLNGKCVRKRTKGLVNHSVKSIKCLRSFEQFSEL